MFHLEPITDAEAYAILGFAFIVGFIIALPFIILMLVANWKIFTKAYEPGWASIVPFYNAYVLTKITTGNGWLFLIMLIPFVGGIFALYLNYKLSLSFGQGAGFALGLIFLPIIFYPILAFGNYRYLGVARKVA